MKHGGGSIEVKTPTVKVGDLDTKLNGAKVTVAAVLFFRRLESIVEVDALTQQYDPEHTAKSTSCVHAAQDQQH